MTLLGTLNAVNRLIWRIPAGVRPCFSGLTLQAKCLSTQQQNGLTRASDRLSDLTLNAGRCYSTTTPVKMENATKGSGGNSLCTDVANAIGSQLQSGDAGRLFAVVHVAGKQRKITTEDIIILDKPVEAAIGERIRLNKVLMVGGRDFSLIGRPILNASQARVEATVLEKTLSHTKIIFWYKKRANFRVFKLRKISYTMLRINDIELTGLEATKNL